MSRPSLIPELSVSDLSAGLEFYPEGLGCASLRRVRQLLVADPDGYLVRPFDPSEDVYEIG